MRDLRSETQGNQSPGLRPGFQGCRIFANPALGETLLPNSLLRFGRELEMRNGRGLPGGGVP